MITHDIRVYCETQPTKRVKTMKKYRGNKYKVVGSKGNWEGYIFKSNELKGERISSIFKTKAKAAIYCECVIDGKITDGYFKEVK